jgi:hypothetical protein
MLRGPDAFDRTGKSETWIFRCDQCGYKFGRKADS